MPRSDNNGGISQIVPQLPVPRVATVDDVSVDVCCVSGSIYDNMQYTIIRHISWQPCLTLVLSISICLSSPNQHHITNSH